MRFSFDPSKPPGQRVVAGSVSVGGAPLSPGATYRLATKEYLADGKDGYNVLEVGGAAAVVIVFSSIVVVISAFEQCWAYDQQTAGRQQSRTRSPDTGIPHTPKACHNSRHKCTSGAGM